MSVIQRHIPYGAAHNAPKMIVIHAMGAFIADGKGGHDYAPDFLEKLGLSAHALVTPNGDIIRCRADTDGAYHARGFNTDSLGMEILAAGTHDYASFLKAIDKPYLMKPQYEAAVAQCREWVKKFDITKIVRHSDLSPGRKVDPGNGFPWDAFKAEVLA